MRIVTVLLAVFLSCSLLHAVDREWATQKRAGFVRVVIAEPEAPVEGGLISAADVEYLGYYDLSDTSGYCRAFCVRRVDSDVRVMMHTFASENKGPLTEWSLSGLNYGGTITSAHRTNQWGVTGTRLFTMNDAHDSMWWDHDHNRLWYLQSVDYPYDGNPYYSSIHISTLTDGAGQVGTTYKVSLENIRDRKHHGGVMTVPASFQAAYGWPEFLVGFGGYASLLTAQQGASMGLSCYAMPDPANYQASAPNYLCGPSNIGAVVPLDDYKTLAERGHADRGVRKHYGYSFTPDGGTQNGQPTGTFATIDGNPVRGPINYYDGGDYRGENPNYAPLARPLTGSAPYYNYNGAIQYNTQNWAANDPVCPWVWGDQYVGGFFAERGLCVVASLTCGRTYYMSSAGYTDQWIAELHVFDPADLAEVTAGTRFKTAVQPKVIIPLTETATSFSTFYFHKFAAGYDPVAKRLYIQANRHEIGPSNVRPFRIYVYQINNI